MGYSGSAEATKARESLGQALGTLQKDPNIPEEVLAVAQNIAQAVGALFDAGRASTEPDGKTSVRNALGSLSQTLALLQEVKGDPPGIKTATEVIAKAMSQLYPLTTVPSRPPSRAPAASVPAGQVARITGSPAPTEADSPAETPPAAADPAPVTKAEAPAAPQDSPSKGVKLDGPRQPAEANIGATTVSNFFVGFSGEISQGGVFLATYDTFPVGTPMNLLITLPGGFEIRAPGYVRFVRDPMDFTADSEPGMGITFEKLEEKGRELVLRFIKKRPPMFYDD